MVPLCAFGFFPCSRAGPSHLGIHEAFHARGRDQLRDGHLRIPSPQGDLLLFSSRTFSAIPSTAPTGAAANSGISGRAADMWGFFPLFFLFVRGQGGKTLHRVACFCRGAYSCFSLSCLGKVQSSVSLDLPIFLVLAASDSRRRLFFSMFLASRFFPASA